MKVLLKKINNPYNPSLGYKNRIKKKSYRKKFRPLCLFFRTNFCNCFMYNRSKVKLLKFILGRLKKLEINNIISNFLHNKVMQHSKTNNENIFNINHCSLLQLCV